MMATVFDTETTGLVENLARKLDSQPEVISLAILNANLETGEISNQYYMEFRPLKPITKQIIEITGITNERLEGAISIQRELPYIIGRLSNAKLLIGQNIRFDMDMLEIECNRYQYEKPNWPRILDLVSNTIHLKGYRLNLTALHLELFGSAFESAHDAMADCMATAKCAIELWKRKML